MVITDEELTRLALALIWCRQGRTVSDDEIGVVYEWAKRIRVDMALLHMVLTDQLVVDVEDGEVFVALPEGAGDPSSAYQRFLAARDEPELALVRNDDRP